MRPMKPRPSVDRVDTSYGLSTLRHRAGPEDEWILYHREDGAWVAQADPEGWRHVDDGMPEGAGGEPGDRTSTVEIWLAGCFEARSFRLQGKWWVSTRNYLAEVVAPDAPVYMPLPDGVKVEYWRWANRGPIAQRRRKSLSASDDHRTDEGEV